MKILFTGGGTGGHIFPIIAVARQIRQLMPWGELELFYVGPKDEWAPVYLDQEGIKIKTILAGKIRRYFTPSALVLNFLDAFKFFVGTVQAFFLVFFKNPDLIFSKGGFGSLPVVVAGKILGVPIFLHESDASPGLANRICGKFALEIFISFPKTEYFKPQKMMIVGSPIRGEVLEAPENPRQTLGLTSENPVLFITGGSQGAQRINDLILLILPQLLKDFEIVHQCGSKNIKQVEAEASAILSQENRKNYHPFPFMKEEEIIAAYYAADLIVSRAGATTLFEIAAIGKPSIIIPLPEAAQNHQFKNAWAMAENGATVMIEEANITPHYLLERIRYLFSNPALLGKMKEAALEFARPRAAEVIAEYLVEYLKT